MYFFTINILITPVLGNDGIQIKENDFLNILCNLPTVTNNDGSLKVSLVIDENHGINIDNGLYIIGHPVVTVNDNAKIYPEHIIYYDPTEEISVIKQPFITTIKGEVLFIDHKKYPSTLHVIDVEGNIKQITTPYNEIVAISANPIKNEIAVFGKLRYETTVKFSIINLDTQETKIIYSHEYNSIPHLSVSSFQVVYDRSGNLYFSTVQNDRPAIYIYDGKEVKLYKREALKPLISPNSKYLAYQNIDFVTKHKSKREANFVIIDLSSNQVIGSINKTGSILELYNDSLYFYNTNAGSLEKYSLKNNSIYLEKITKIEAKPFISNEPKANIYSYSDYSSAVIKKYQ